MYDDQRVSVTFGAFACDVVGYDEPFSVLRCVVDKFIELSRENGALSGMRLSNGAEAALARSLKQHAAALDFVADPQRPGGLRLVVSRRVEAEAPAAAAPAAAAQPVRKPIEIAPAAKPAPMGIRELIDAVKAELIAAEADAAKAAAARAARLSGRKPLGLRVAPEAAAPVAERPAEKDEPAAAKPAEAVKPAEAAPAAEPTSARAETPAASDAAFAADLAAARAVAEEGAKPSPLRRREDAVSPLVRSVGASLDGDGERVGAAPAPRLVPAPAPAPEAKAADEDDISENFLFDDVEETAEAPAPRPAPAADAGWAPVAPPEAKAPISVKSGVTSPLKSLAGMLSRRKRAAVEEETPAEEAPAEPDMPALAAPAPPPEATPAPAATRLAATGPFAVAEAPEENEAPAAHEAEEEDGELSPTSFARRVGASSLHELLEASAAYMAIVEGRSRFSRRDVMVALNRIGSDADHSHEARLKTFRKLLTTGALVRVEDGLFAVSPSTRDDYQLQLSA